MQFLRDLSDKVTFNFSYMSARPPILNKSFMNCVCKICISFSNTYSDLRTIIRKMAYFQNFQIIVICFWLYEPPLTSLNLLMLSSLKYSITERINSKNIIRNTYFCTSKWFFSVVFCCTVWEAFHLRRYYFCPFSPFRPEN